MLEKACTSPRLFDRLLERISEIPDPSFPGPFLGYDTYHSIKDCPLGEDYGQSLADRLLKEERPKHRKVIRDAIRWHGFHAHAEKSARRPYEESVASKVRSFVRRDEEDERWYGVVQAIYARYFPEASAEMWSAIRTYAQKTDGNLAIGAFETSFNKLRESSWRYRAQFVKECLKFIEESRDQENPWAAGWMLKRKFTGYARHGPNLQPGEVFEWETTLLDSASRARSQVHRGEAILALLELRSPRVVPILENWMRQDLPDSVVEDFLSELRIESTGDRDLLAEVDHPRLRARLTVGREREKRYDQDGEGSAVSYLLGILKTDPKPEMRQEALYELAYWLRDDERDARDGLPQGMSNRLDLLDIVRADPSPKVRRVLARAFERHMGGFSGVSPERLDQIRELCESEK